MSKEILTLGDTKLKKFSFTTIRPLFFYHYLKDVDIEKVLVSKKISFSDKNYKYFICSLYNDNEVRPLHLMLPKARVCIKRMMDKLNGCIF